MSDISITAGSVVPSAAAQLERRTANVDLTAGQTVYKLANGKIGPFDANGVAPICVLEGIMVDTAAAGQPGVYCKKDPALVIGATLVIGDTLWASATPGGITKTFADIVSGWFVTSLGVANSTTAFNFNPTAAGAVKP